MFQTVVIQITVPFLFGDYQLLPLDQEPLTDILAREIDKLVGGKVYQNQLLRKGAKYFTVKSFDLPEASGAEILFLVQCEAFGLLPLCSEEAVYQMKVVETFSETMEALCEWPDPVTGCRSLLTMVDLADEPKIPDGGSLIHVCVLDFTLEYTCDHIKCVGVVASSDASTKPVGRPKPDPCLDALQGAKVLRNDR